MNIINQIELNGIYIICVWYALPSKWLIPEWYILKMNSSYASSFIEITEFMKRQLFFISAQLLDNKCPITEIPCPLFFSMWAAKWTYIFKTNQSSLKHMSCSGAPTHTVSNMNGKKPPCKLPVSILNFNILTKIRELDLLNIIDVSND